MQFQLALTLAEGKTGLKRVLANHDYDVERLKSPQIQALMQKVRTAYNKDLDKEWEEQCLYASTVKIETEDGNEYSQYVKYPKGEPENDMSREELKEKFVTLTTRLLTQEKANTIIETIDEIEKLQDVRELTSLFSYDNVGKTQIPQNAHLK